MATVNAQSVEDFADRIVYRFPAARFEQVPVTIKNTGSPGLKTLVNVATSTSFMVPASGMAARFFKIEWIINTSVVLTNTASGTILQMVKIDFLKYLASSLNYDGKSQQIEFYEKNTENYYTSPQLRAINIGNISIEPIIETTNMSGAGFGLNAVIDWDISSSVSYIVALLHPVVTFYKK